MSQESWKQRAASLQEQWNKKLAPRLVDYKNQLNQFIAKIKPRKNTNLIGIDINPNFLWLIKISWADNQYIIDAFATLPVPEGVIIKDEVKNTESIINLLQELISTAQIETKNAVIAISRSSAIIKNITIDSRLTESEIESRAWIEANRLFPDLVGNIYLDFNIIGPSNMDSSQLDMALVACRKDVINPYIAILKGAGLEPSIVDINCYALARALPFALSKSDDAKTIALLNLDNQLSTLIVMHEGSLVYAHDESFDGSRLKKIVAQTTGQPNPSKTTEAKPTQHLQPEQSSTTADSPEAVHDNDNKSKLMTALKDAISSHLLHTMHFFLSSHPDITIQKIVFSGDCTNIPHLDTIIQQETGINTVIAKPLQNLAVNPALNESLLSSHQAQLMECIGLALSGYDRSH